MSSARARSGVARLGVLALSAAVIAGCSPASAPVPAASSTPTASPTASASVLPDPGGAPSPSATPLAPLYFTFQGTWERHTFTGAFCTVDDDIFMGSPQGVWSTFDDPAFAFYRGGRTLVVGTTASMPETYQGFVAEGPWEFAIGPDGLPTGISGTLLAEWGDATSGPAGVHHFTADLAADVTPGYDDPDLIEFCA